MPKLTLPLSQLTPLGGKTYPPPGATYPPRQKNLPPSVQAEDELINCIKDSV